MKELFSMGIEVYLIIFGCVGIIMLFLSLVFPSANIFYWLLVFRKYKKVQYESEYFRDMLTYSPSEIFLIYNKNFKYTIKTNTFLRYKYRKLMFINLLKMELLGYIDIDFSNKYNFKVIKKDVVILEQEYSEIVNYIFNYVTNLNEVRLYDIYDYINYNLNDEFFWDWDLYINRRIRSRGFYEGNFLTFHGDRIKTFYKISIPILIIICLAFMVYSVNTGVLMLVSFPFLLLFGFYENKHIKVVSDEGVYEYRKMKALKKFLKHFSILDQRDPSYSQILDDYVVYANIFNIQRQRLYLGNIISEVKHFFILVFVVLLRRK